MHPSYRPHRQVIKANMIAVRIRVTLADLTGKEDLRCTQDDPL